MDEMYDMEGMVDENGNLIYGEEMMGSEGDEDDDGQHHHHMMR
jgi:hypothetical protein